MKRIRVIPVLLLKGDGLYKTKGFKYPNYIGDPLNAIRIFNEKEVDELIVLDIEATKKKQPPNFKLIKEFAQECFMPLCYGGGIRSIEDARRIISIGVEKLSFNDALTSNLGLIKECVKEFGAQSVVVSIDVKKNLFGKKKVFSYVKNKRINDINSFIQIINRIDIGEILLTSVDNEGLYKGYDIELLKYVSQITKVPIIANGGVSNLTNFVSAYNSGNADAFAASSLFVYSKKGKGVLINYPSQEELVNNVFNKLHR